MNRHHLFNRREWITIVLTVMVVTPDFHTGYLLTDLICFMLASRPVLMMVLIMMLMAKWRQPPF